MLYRPVLEYPSAMLYLYCQTRQEQGELVTYPMNQRVLSFDQSVPLQLAHPAVVNY